MANPSRPRVAGELPLANSYWVLPGRLLAGEHPFGANPAEANDRLMKLRESGIDSFIDLTEIGEMPNYRRLLPRSAEYTRFAIPDTEVPRELAQMLAIQARLGDALARERGIYVHCRAGIGRTGVVIGCFLADGGLDGKASLKALNRLWQQSARAQSWPKVPQTEDQARYILDWPARRRAVEAGERGER